MAKHRPTKALRRSVELAARCGLSNKQIAASVLTRRSGHWSVDVLKTHYHNELEQGRADGVQAVARTVLERATGADGAPPDVRAGLWFLERRGGYEEKPRQLEVGPAGSFSRLDDTELEAEILKRQVLLEASDANKAD